MLTLGFMKSNIHARSAAFKGAITIQMEMCDFVDFLRTITLLIQMHLFICLLRRLHLGNKLAFLLCALVTKSLYNVTFSALNLAQAPQSLLPFTRTTFFRFVRKFSMILSKKYLFANEERITFIPHCSIISILVV